MRESSFELASRLRAEAEALEELFLEAENNNSYHARVEEESRRSPSVAGDAIEASPIRAAPAAFPWRIAFLRYPPGQGQGQDGPGRSPRTPL